MASKEIVKEGNGVDSPLPLDTVHIHYVGTNLDGTKFDSSRDRDKPFVTEIGVQKVIQAWDDLVPTMTLGEKAKFICPPDTAYGARGFPGLIAGGSTICFELELLKIIRHPNNLPHSSAPNKAPSTSEKTPHTSEKVAPMPEKNL